MTTSDHVAATLTRALERDWITPAEVHTGVRAWDASRSHRVVVVEVGDGGIVVKHHRRADDDVQGSRSREVAAYRLAGSAPRLAGLAPALVDDVADGPLVVERVPGTDLAALRRDGRRGDHDLLRRAATALGRWHRHTADVDAAPFRPWVLDALGADRPAFLDSNEGARTFLADAPTERLRGPLRRLDELRRATALVHGDLRFDNVVLDGERVTFIDWECAGRGDPAWDLGALAADVLAESGVREAGDRLAPPVRAALEALVAGYRDGGHADPRDWDDRLGLACAARLVQRALQVAGAAPEPDPEEERLATLAAQLGADPSRLLAAASSAP